MKTLKAALIYYDNYLLASHLSTFQLGALFRALMEYGLLTIRGEDMSIRDFSQYHPEMDDSTYGFFAFMADSIRRDAATYREKCANYSAAAQKREAEKAKARTAEAPDSPESRQAEAAHYIRLLKDRSRAAEEEPRP